MAEGNKGLFIKLYLDRHVIVRLAVDLRAQGFDVLTTQEADMDRATDEEQLAFAAEQGRTILTFNIRDFVKLHRGYVAHGCAHAGIVVSRQFGSREYGILLRRVLKLLDSLTADEMKGNLVYLEQFKE